MRAMLVILLALTCSAVSAREPDAILIVGQWHQPHQPTPFVCQQVVRTTPYYVMECSPRGCSITSIGQSQELFWRCQPASRPHYDYYNSPRLHESYRRIEPPNFGRGPHIMSSY